MAASVKEKDIPVFYEQASPLSLSKQPVSTKKKPESDKLISGTDWNVLKNHLESRLNMLRTWRDTWWIQNYSDLARFILPRRSIWLTQSAGGLPSPNSMTRGLEINESIVDPTATFAARICSGGLMSGLASPSRPWFKIIPAMRGVEIDDAARNWLDTVEDIVYTVLARSNFYNSFAQQCEDIVIYGTSVNIIYEDEKDLIRCYTPCVGEYYLASGATMRVDALNRVFVMTIAQIVDFFGLENCTPDIQKLWNEKGGALTTERLIAHSIEPNFEVAKGVGRLKGNFAWRETYWVYGAGSAYPLVIRGFVEQPFTAARWATQSNDAYGRSPGMDILPDVMQLQVETMRKAEGIEKGLRPPLIAHMELKNSPTSQLPGHVTFVNDMSAGKGMRSIYESQFDLKDVSADLALIQQRIKVGLFNDLFLLISTETPNQKTAVEIQAKIQEKQNVLGPVIENLLSESLQPMLRRVFGILKRRKMIPPPPDSLKNQPLDIQFVSLLALAQKAASTSGLEAIVNMAGSLVKIGKADVLDNLDGDGVLQEYNELLGNKQKLLKGPNTVAQIRQQRQEAQQKQQQAEMLSHTADTSQKGASAAASLAQVPVGTGQTALSAIMGTGASGTQRL